MRFDQVSSRRAILRGPRVSTHQATLLFLTAFEEAGGLPASVGEVR